MRILYEYSHGCQKHINQDVYGYRDNIFWVIDGATEVYNNQLLSQNGDVFWIVQHLNDALKHQDICLPLIEYVYSAVTEVHDEAVTISPEVDYVPIHEAPSYAICCVRCINETIEYLVLGDCSLYVSHSPKDRYSDFRILPFHIHINEIKKQFQDDTSRYNYEVQNAVRKIKHFINKDDGYWIGTLNPEIVYKAVTGKIPWSNEDRFLLCSDGFLPSLEESGFFAFQITDIFDPELLSRLLKKQNAEEQNYKRRTGIDISDDKTVLLVSRN